MAGARDSTVVIHRELREAILRGTIPAGTGLSQVQLARRFGVSRGPVREALRMLQREGLIEAEVNQRARVAAFSVEDLEQLYAVRVVVEALGIRVSVPHLTDADFAEIERCLAAMDRLAGGDIERWERPHRRFHQLLVSHAGARTVELIDELHDHAERYRRVHAARDPGALAQAAEAHREIVAACRAGDERRAATLLASHLAGTALGVLAIVAPEHETAVVHAAVTQVSG